MHHNDVNEGGITEVNRGAARGHTQKAHTTRTGRAQDARRARTVTHPEHTERTQ